MSNATNYTINSFAAVRIFQKKPDNCMLYNTSSTATVFVDKYPGVTASSGFPIPPLSTKIWSAGDECWAVSDATCVMNVSDNAGDVANPKAIADSLISSGLAQDIADAVFLQGVPPVDKYTLLDNSGAFTGAAGYLTPALDTTNYNSLKVTFANGFVSPLVNGRITVIWYATSGLITDIDASAVGTGTSINAGDKTVWEFPVKGPFCEIRVDADSGGSNNVMLVYGSYKALTKSLYSAVNAGSASGTVEGGSLLGFNVWSSTIAAGAALQLWQPDCIAGHAKLQLRATTTSSMTFLFRILAPTATVYNLASEVNIATAPGSSFLYDLILPPQPLEISIANTHATLSLQFRASLTYENPF